MRIKHQQYSRTLRNAARLMIVPLFFCLQLSAAHPQLMMDADDLRFMRAKVAARSPDWLALMTYCDDLANRAVRWPSVYGDSSTALIEGSGAGPPYIDPGYAGSGYYGVIRALGACYQAASGTDAASAQRYASKGQFVLTAMTEPPPVMTRESDARQYS